MKTKLHSLVLCCLTTAMFEFGQKEVASAALNAMNDDEDHSEKTCVNNGNSDVIPKCCITDPKIALQNFTTVEEFEKCSPYYLPDYARNYFQAAAGRQITIQENKNAYKRLQIYPKMLRDVSETNLTTYVQKHRISMPIGADPVAFQRLASDLGELDTVRAIDDAGTFMVVSSYSSTTIEDLAKAAPTAIKWIQTYIFPNRNMTLNLVRRAKAAGFKAVVVTVDSPISGPLPMNVRSVAVSNPKNVTAENLRGTNFTVLDSSLTFRDLAWLCRNAKLPVVAKGILTVDDALSAATHGAAGVLVSNHGGRQLDSTPATIDVLPKIVDALKILFPHVEVYCDGGVRNGWDVFKALAYGAKAVLIGRPIIWGLATGGQDGVRKVMEILRTELNETMMLAGTPNVHSIERIMVRRNGALTCLH